MENPIQFQGNWLDLLILALVGAGAFRGFKRGLVREALGFAGLAAGAVLGARYQSEAAALLKPFVGSGAIVDAGAYLLILLATLAAATVVSLILRRLLRLLFMGWLDRLGGMLFGAGQGAALVVVAMFLLLKFSIGGVEDVIKGSQVAPMLLGLLPMALGYLPPELSGVAKFFELPEKP